MYREPFFRPLDLPLSPSRSLRPSPSTARPTPPSYSRSPSTERPTGSRSSSRHHHLLSTSRDVLQRVDSAGSSGGSSSAGREPARRRLPSKTKSKLEVSLALRESVVFVQPPRIDALTGLELDAGKDVGSWPLALRLFAQIVYSVLRPGCGVGLVSQRAVLCRPARRDRLRERRPAVEWVRDAGGVQG